MLAQGIPPRFAEPISDAIGWRYTGNKLHPTQKPLGIISIGIVPMGVVSIGVVPMGVLSIGAVGMGVINACVVGMGILVAGVNVMGVWWAGMEGMGPYQLGAGGAQVHHHHDQRSSPNIYAYPSKAVAQEKARELGCEGVHRMGSLWMPCKHHPGP